MNRNEFLRKIDEINVWKNGEKRAPHKPLLLLLALGRVLNGEDRLASYLKDIEPELGQLLQRFGPPRKALHPAIPFGRLRADGLWQIPESDRLTVTASGDFSVRELRHPDIAGGFPEAIYHVLRNASELVREAAQNLLDGHFPESLHDDIREAVGIPRTWEMRDSPIQSRDPAFRREVLREYERRCAICEFDVRLGDELIGVEAAHIKWHAAGGPDEVSNGLALCWLHHKAFDRGALGLAAAGNGLKVLVSSEIHGLSQPLHWFLDFHDKPLRPPRNRRLDPKPEFINWHQREVFRKPPLGGDDGKPSTAHPS